MSAEHVERHAWRGARVLGLRVWGGADDGMKQAVLATAKGLRAGAARAGVATCMLTSRNSPGPHNVVQGLTARSRA